MKCLTPYWLKNSALSKVLNRVDLPAPYGFPVPCGHCLSCRLSAVGVWSFRMSMEALGYESDNIAFVTLTYANEHCPSGYNLAPSHLQGFFKRLRRYLPYKIRYYACGEYGTKRGRPHYHAIIYGLRPQDYEFVNKAWSLGLVQCDKYDSTRGGFEYVAGYVTKKIGSHYKRRDGRVAEFGRCSLGLGRDEFLKRVPFFSPVVRFNGHIQYIGRYLRTKLAEKFQILDRIVAQGIIASLDSLQEMVDMFCLRFPELSYSMERSPRVPFELGKAAWADSVSGLANLLESKQRLYEISVKRL